MCKVDRRVLCNSGEIKDVEHILVRCEKFRWERQDLLEKIRLMKHMSGWKSMEGWSLRERWHCFWGEAQKVWREKELGGSVHYGESKDVVAEAERNGLRWKSP